MFSETLLDHFRNPRNAGTLDPPALTVRVENPICGDIITLSALADEGVIREVRFQVRGCTASIAAGSAVTELLLGRTGREAARIEPAALEEALDGLPTASKHAARLASDAAKALGASLESLRQA